MINNNDIKKAMNDYINSEFSIRIYKEKGAENTKQVYQGTKAEIGTCIASMVEQLIRNGIFTPDEMFFTINMAVEKLKKDFKEEK